MTRYDTTRARWRLNIFSRKETTSNARDGVDSPVLYFLSGGLGGGGGRRMQSARALRHATIRQ